MDYLKIKFNITCKADMKDIVTDLLTDMAGECGCEAFTDDNDELTGYVQTELFNKPALDMALEEFPIDDTTITYEVETAPNENWNKEWEENGFDPIKIEGKCTIFDAKRVDAETIATQTAQTELPMSIFIDARQAFGTGTHETTQMIVSHLFQMDLKDKNVLDCGCGTGILSIVASKLGAAKVVAYDIDEWSVDNTRHNAELNNVSNIEVLHGNATILNHVSGVFDVVMANINRNILIADMENFIQVMRHGTTLILSGFYEEDIPLLLEEAKKHDLRETLRDSANNWACLVLTYK